MIQLGKPDISNEDVDFVVKVLESANLVTGKEVQKFEADFSNYVGKEYGIAVNSGTIALYLSIRGMDLKKVIIPAVTCPDVLNAVLNAGATPIVVDVDRETHNLDPEKLTPKIIEEADGLIVTNAYGHPAKLNEITEICQKNGLFFIEDFSQSTGAYYRKQKCGSFGEISITSFYGPKAITTGHGGMILTNSKNFCHKLRVLRGDMPYEYVESMVPLNFKMTDFQAALGRSQLKRLDSFVERRRKIAKQYDAALEDIASTNTSIDFLKEHEDVIHSYYKYVILLNKIDKLLFIEEMRKRGIQVGGLYDPPLNRSKIFKKFVPDDVSLPVAEKCVSRSVSIPMYPSMSVEDVNMVIDSIRQVVQNV